MLFKTNRQAAEWRVMCEEGTSLVPVVMYAAAHCEARFQKTVVVTEILRTEAEHIALCQRLGIEKYLTVHSFWRGVDLRSRDFTNQEVMLLVNSINARFEYGGGKKVAVFHDVGAGSHVHLQTKTKHGCWRP
jgi:hypothetical protein